jgi:hypothetical protein
MAVVRGASVRQGIQRVSRQGLTATLAAQAVGGPSAPTQTISSRPFAAAVSRACTWIDWSRPTASSVTSTDDPP